MIQRLKRWWKRRKSYWPISSRNEFTTDPANTRWARGVLYGPEGRELQAHLLEGIFAQRFYPGDAVTQEQAAFEYARIAGYIECFRRLQACAQEPPKIEPPLEPTYTQEPSIDEDLEDQ